MLALDWGDSLSLVRCWYTPMGNLYATPQPTRATRLIPFWSRKTLSSSASC